MRCRWSARRAWTRLSGESGSPKFRLIGHYDKMVMNKGEAAIRSEFDRLAPLARIGGFIPSVDHQTPPGVSLEEYRVYLRQLREFVRSTHP